MSGSDITSDPHPTQPPTKQWLLVWLTVTSVGNNTGASEITQSHTIGNQKLRSYWHIPLTAASSITSDSLTLAILSFPGGRVKKCYCHDNSLSLYYPSQGQPLGMVWFRSGYFPCLAYGDSGGGDGCVLQLHHFSKLCKHSVFARAKSPKICFAFCRTDMEENKR